MVEPARHRLIAILAADAVGYSRLMAADDVATLAALEAAREVFRVHVTASAGRVVDTTGDSVLAVFQSATGAVSAALAIQDELRRLSGDVSEDRRMLFRIGVHMGDVIEKADGTVYGDGVNIAARLQALGDPGGILVSDAVHGAVRGSVRAEFIDGGEQQVKNIAHPLRAFSVVAVRPSADGGEPTPASTRILRLPDKPSIAVLPFVNMSGDPEQEYFADGITEDIITDVSKVSGLFVIARNSSFTFKKRSVDIREVGKKLGVRHVLEGSVRKVGTRVRINVQLVDAESGGHVWADRYDREVEDIFVVQDEVSQKIVQMLEVTLTKAESARWQERGKVNAEAYDYLIRGRSCLLAFNAAALVEGRAMLERAIALDAGMGQAYAYLALACVYEYINGWNSRTASHLEEALALAKKACEVEPLGPMSHHALAVSLMLLRRLREAESEARRAIELDPNFSLAHGALGNVLHFTGRHEQALESLERALRLDPQFNVWMHAVGRAQFTLRRYDDAEAMFKRRLIHMPTSDVTRAYLASLYGHTHRHEDARRVWDELMAINPQYTIEHTLRVLPFTNPGPLDHFVEGLRKSGLAQ